jgi:MFS family permease
MMSLGDLRYKGLFVAGGILTYCLCLVLLACSPWFLLSVVVTMGLGFFDSVQAIPRNTAIQLITPNELRGRVSSFQSMLTNGAPALGQAQSGAVAAMIGAPLAIGAGAVTCAALILGITTARHDLRAADL